MSKLDFLKDGQFPILRVPLDLGEYHEDLAGNSVSVWVNLSRDFLDRLDAYRESVEVAVKPCDDKIAELQQKITKEAGKPGGLTDEQKAKLKGIRQQIADSQKDKVNTTLPPGVLAERAAIYAEWWDLPLGKCEALFSSQEAMGLVTWMREQTWKLVDEYGGRRAKVGSG